jgi:hypothetical protein
MFGLKKAEIIVTDGEMKDEKFLVQFNPASYTINKNVSFNEKYSYGNSTSLLQFSKVEGPSVDFQVVFDTYMDINPFKKDVRIYTDAIESLTSVDDKIKSPPRILFKYGSLEFDGYITATVTKYTMFTSSGKPVRALVDIKMKCLEKAKAPGSSSDRIKKLKETFKDSNPRKGL